MPSTVPAVKPGLRLFLATQLGLREADGVRVHSAPVTPEEAGDKHIILGDVTAPQAKAGLASRAETPTVTCYSGVIVPGSGEDAINAARDGVYALWDIAEQALRDDPTAAGTVPGPGQIAVTTSTLEETPVDLDGTAGRKAQLTVQLSWTSHIT